MKMVNWKCSNFDELNKYELYAILRLRSEVFVVEQNCPYQDLDDLDQKCIHLLGYSLEGNLIAYARILPEGVSPYEVIGENPSRHASIGRVVISQLHRGIGHELMNKAIEIYENNVGKDVPCIIHAQAHLHHFYESHGFRQSSGHHPIDGIDHIEMIRY